jgi:hypothetical protein
VSVLRFPPIEADFLRAELIDWEMDTGRKGQTWNITLLVGDESQVFKGRSNDFTGSDFSNLKKFDSVLVEVTIKETTYEGRTRTNFNLETIQAVGKATAIKSA